ncbi:MAG: Gfo/Idh/MocA family oxidoreductase, partial [Bacillota bacterium]
MTTLAVIGAGQLGSRHLQALGLITCPVNIEVVDPSTASLTRAHELFYQVPRNENILSIRFLNRLEDLSQEIAVAVVATNSDIRRKVVENLLHTKQVRALLLEKILFQKYEDYTAVYELLQAKKVKAWVNCPRRMWPFHAELKHLMDGSRWVEYTVSGSNWGLGCNAIHFIDHLASITGSLNFTFNTNLLDREIKKSSRQGYIEFTGTLYGWTERHDKIYLTSYPEGNAPVLVEINSDILRCVLRENEGIAMISQKETGWQWKELNF